MTTPDRTAAPMPGRRFQYRLRTLLLLPLVVAIGSTVYRHIEQNRDQREAVHQLWQMGGSTANKPGDVFWGPSDRLDMIWHNKEGRLDNLQGTHEQWAVAFYRHGFSYDMDELAATIRRVPSIKHMFVWPGIMSAEELARLRPLLPEVEIHPLTEPPFIPPPDGAGIARQQP
jgi:hypothetical protein